jgi:hypothetical protein
LDHDPFNGHFVDLLYSKDNKILGDVNPDNYICLMVKKGSNYWRSENNLKIRNTFAATASVKNCAFVVYVTLII